MTVPEPATARLNAVRTRVPLVALFAGALALRYALMAFNHVWDITTFYNMFVNLATGTNPYDEFVRLTHESRASTSFWSRWYPYYAYPPGLIYLYTPIANLWADLTSARIATEYLPLGAVSYPPRGVLDPWFLFLFKTPIFLADLAIGALLVRMADLRIAALYLFNPLVVLISAMWMFDAIPLFFLLLGVYFVDRGHPVPAGAAIAVGTVFKFFPAFVAPAIVLYYLRREEWAFLSFGLSLVVVLGALMAPFVPDLLPTLSYHGSRSGGGMTLHSLIYLYSTLSDGSVLWLQTLLSPRIGSLTLVGGMAITYVLIHRWQLTLYSSVVVALAGFFLSTKLVNEQYAMWIIPAMLLLIADHPTPMRRLLYKATYAIPIAFAIINVPMLIFFYPLAMGQDVGFLSSIQYPEAMQAVALVFFAIAFMVTMALSIRHFAVPSEAIDA